MKELSSNDEKAKDEASSQVQVKTNLVLSLLNRCVCLSLLPTPDQVLARSDFSIGTRQFDYSE